MNPLVRDAPRFAHAQSATQSACARPERGVATFTGRRKRRPLCLRGRRRRRLVVGWRRRVCRLGASVMAGCGGTTASTAERSLTDDEMAEVKKEVLEQLRRYLCEKIIAERHFDYLRSKKILSREDTEEISCRASSRKKAGKLLDYLAEHPKGLDALIESIRLERTQNFLLQKITDAILKAKK